MLKALAQGLVEYGTLQPGAGAAQAPFASVMDRLRQIDQEMWIMIAGAMVVGWLVWNAFVGGRR